MNCTICRDRRGIYLSAGAERLMAVCFACNANGAATPDLPEWGAQTGITGAAPVMPRPVSEQLGPVAWCEECGRNRVQFNWREDRQLCPECAPAEVIL